MTGSERIGDVDRDSITLFGWPHMRDRSPRPGSLCVLGVPTDYGNPIARGAAWAPAAIRRASLALERPTADGIDCGDLDADAVLDPGEAMTGVAALAADIRDAGGCPLVLGGDHSITYAPVAALQQGADLCVIWVDAHTDFSPWAGTDFHDHKQVLRRIYALEGVRRIVQIGYRGITAGDERWLGSKAAVVTTAAARALDSDALLALIPADLRCYLSIDIDVIDPAWAPGTSAPVPGGLAPADVARLLATLVRHRTVVGIDVVEVNPLADTGDATAGVAADLLHTIATAWADRRPASTTLRPALASQEG